MTEGIWCELDAAIQALESASKAVEAEALRRVGAAWASVLACDDAVLESALRRMSG